MVEVGDLAPDFEGHTDAGEMFQSRSVLGKSPLVLYFYPKDETPGCTKEACTFRDRWEELSRLGATVVGISSDSPESHTSFKKHHNLPFTLVSDANREIRKKFGVTGVLIPPRVTFVVDKNGRIVKKFNSQLHPERHVDEAIRALEALPDSTGPAS
jgi:peroxiredoxin Q/BCP